MVLKNTEPCSQQKKWPSFSCYLSSRVNNVPTRPEEIADNGNTQEEKRDLTNIKADDDRTINGWFVSHANRAKL